jgi:hypothetical protein
VLALDMIEILPPLGKYKYDTWRILPMKCYIDNSVCLWSCIRNINSRNQLLEQNGMHNFKGLMTMIQREGSLDIALRFVVEG